MPVQAAHLCALIDLWSRRHQPAGEDTRTALHLAKRFEEDDSSPTHLRALAWRLATEVVAATGWEIPDLERLHRCQAAASDIERAAAAHIDGVQAQLAGHTGRVLLLGPIAASRTAFGCWDLLPPEGLLVVPVDGPPPDLPSSTRMLAVGGIRWAAPGRLLDTYLTHSIDVQLGDLGVRVPDAILLTARSAMRGANLEHPSCLPFLAAARAVARADRWDEVRTLCRTLGCPVAPAAATLRLGVTGWLGLRVSLEERLGATVRRLLDRRRAASI